MEDPAAAVAADRAADLASLGWVFRWVWTVFGLGFPVSLVDFWVFVDFWVSVNFWLC